MNEQVLEKYIKSAIDAIDKHEEDIRLDIVRVILLNKDIESNHTMYELVEREKNMNSKQLEILKYIKEELVNSAKKEEDFLNIMKELNILLENINIEMYHSCVTEFISALLSSNDNIFSIAKIYIRQIFGSNHSFNLNSRYDLINDLIEETKDTEDMFNRNYQKIKRRREKKDE